MTHDSLIGRLNNLPMKSIDQVFDFLNENAIHVYNIHKSLDKDLGKMGQVMKVTFDLSQDEYKGTITIRGIEHENRFWSPETHGFVLAY